MKYLGRNSLVKRLAYQVGSESLARELLQKRGHMDSKGRLTSAGKIRDRMTAAERAKDRASKRSGRPTSSFNYNSRTNQATLKRRKRGKG